MRGTLPTSEFNSASGLTIVNGPPLLVDPPAVPSQKDNSDQLLGVVEQSLLKRLVIQGSAWTIMGHGCSQGLRLVSNLVLTHLLFPRAFGVMMLVNIFVHGFDLPQ